MGQIQSLAQELPHATAKKKQKQKQMNNNKNPQNKQAKNPTTVVSCTSQGQTSLRPRWFHWATTNVWARWKLSENLCPGLLRLLEATCFPWFPLPPAPSKPALWHFIRGSRCLPSLYQVFHSGGHLGEPLGVTWVTPAICPHLRILGLIECAVLGTSP